ENAGIRAECDLRNEKIGFKIREAQLEKTPYMVVLGDQEVESGELAIRGRKGDLGKTTLDAFTAMLTAEIQTRAL
ncbi:MAG: threonine--tRNA ligase, partial [Oscillospiraceae bacterium]|nr:threonine--tRNA ligase [Oscillospiraceae bacterium]